MAMHTYIKVNEVPKGFATIAALGTKFVVTGSTV